MRQCGTGCSVNTTPQHSSNTTGNTAPPGNHKPSTRSCAFFWDGPQGACSAARNSNFLSALRWPQGLCCVFLAAFEDALGALKTQDSRPTREALIPNPLIQKHDRCCDSNCIAFSAWAPGTLPLRWPLATPTRPRLSLMKPPEAPNGPRVRGLLHAKAVVHCQRATSTLVPPPCAQTPLFQVKLHDSPPTPSRTYSQ